MEEFLQDLKFAVRQLLQRRSTSIVAVVTLALGIGANTSMFTLMDVTLFRAPPAVKPDQLAWITTVSQRSGNYQSMSYPDYVDVRDRARTFSGILAYSHVRLSFGGTSPQRVRGELVTGNYFDVLGVRPQLGRNIRIDEDGAPGAHPVAMLSDNFWRTAFGADSSVINRTITINGRPFTVVGVTPAGFAGVEMNDDEPQAIWLPMAMLAEAQPDWIDFLTDRYSSGWLRVMGRLAPGATRKEASAEVAVIAASLRAPKPTAGASARGDSAAAAARARSDRDAPVTLAVLPVAGAMDPSNRKEVFPILSLLMLVPLLVLVVACANAANVLLARGLARRKEIAVRRALGASRARLIRQLLTESVLLAIVAAVVGILFSFWMTTLIGRLGNIPPAIMAVLTPNPNVMYATALLAVVAGALFGLAPALTATRPELTPALKNEGVTVQFGRRRHRLRDVFVVSQVAISLVLIVTAGLFTQSVSKALRTDPGFAARSGVFLSFDLGQQGYSPERQQAFRRELITRVGAVPGVEVAALATSVPFGGSYEGGSAIPEGAPDDAQGVSYLQAAVSTHFLDALQVPLLRGRGFTDRDNANSTPVVIVNERLARRLWPTGDAMGKRLQLGRSAKEPLREVVGIVRDGKYANLTEPSQPYLFTPLEQRPSATLVLTARTRADGPAMAGAVRRAAQALDTDLPLFRVTTFAVELRNAVDKQQAASSMLAVFGALALILAALGMFSVTAHGVAQRTREIGIRMSLGARAADVLRLFVREGIARSVVGVVIGLALSAALSRVLSTFLFGLTATDGATFVGGAVILGGVAAVASYLPARRAARVDPVVAMRSE